jgi:hypothetical protein
LLRCTTDYSCYEYKIEHNQFSKARQTGIAQSSDIEMLKTIVQYNDWTAQKELMIYAE